MGYKIKPSQNYLLKKYTIHIHPIASNIVSVSKKSKEIFREIFSKKDDDQEVFYIDYKPPGIDLANEITKEISSNKLEINNYKTLIFFLENHGVICSSETKNNLIDTVEKFVKKFEK